MEVVRSDGNRWSLQVFQAFGFDVYDTILILQSAIDLQELRASDDPSVLLV